MSVEVDSDRVLRLTTVWAVTGQSAPLAMAVGPLRAWVGSELLGGRGKDGPETSDRGGTVKAMWNDTVIAESEDTVVATTTSRWTR